MRHGVTGVQTCALPISREDRNFGARNEGFAPRPDFGDRKPAFARPAGKVFVPRDAAKKAGKFSKPTRD